VILHVKQRDPNGCVLACVAMIQGLTYDEARARYGDPGSGKTYHWWMDQLGQAGFAYQLYFKFSQQIGGFREPWPLQPWAPAHLCSVDAGRGSGTHLCVMLADGSILDPYFETPQRLSDYPDVTYMAGIWQTGGSDGRML
jgi:hypothetical protein